MEIGDIIRWVDGAGSPPSFAELQSISTHADTPFAEMINGSGVRLSWPLYLCSKATPVEILAYGKQSGARDEYMRIVDAMRKLPNFVAINTALKAIAP